MSQENVEVVARLVDAWNQANVEAMLALFDPECEVIFPPEVPEPGPFHGHTELREWAEGFLAAWESHHAEVVELIEADHSIVAILHLIGRGSGSGIEMDETDAHVFTFSDGKVTRWRNFSDRSEALEAAGLREYAMSRENFEVVRGTRITLTPLSESASRRRGLDERLFVRFPALYRLLSDALMRLPPRSRLRRLMLTHRVGQAYAAANRRDFDSVLVGWDPGSEYRPSPDLVAPDEEAVFYGREGYLQLWRYWSDAFDDIRWDPEEILDLADRFLVTTQQRGHGSGSGVAVNKPVFQLFTLRRGLVVRQEDFADRDQALEAAGLRE